MHIYIYVYKNERNNLVLLIANSSTNLNYDKIYMNIQKKNENKKRGKMCKFLFFNIEK